MLLGFKKQFAEYVASGSKTHTIRAHRKIIPKVGELCHCYTGLRQRGPIIQKLASGEVVRQKMARLLGRFPLVNVEQIKIESHPLQGIPLLVRINGELLSPDEANALFRRDGFRDEGGETFTHMHQAAEFWKGRLPFEGIVIHWSFSGKP